MALLDRADHDVGSCPDGTLLADAVLARLHVPKKPLGWSVRWRGIWRSQGTCPPSACWCDRAPCRAVEAKVELADPDMDAAVSAHTEVPSWPHQFHTLIAGLLAVAWTAGLLLVLYYTRLDCWWACRR
jgi:hypothetical protein